MGGPLRVQVIVQQPTAVSDASSAGPSERVPAGHAGLLPMSGAGSRPACAHTPARLPRGIGALNISAPYADTRDVAIASRSTAGRGHAADAFADTLARARGGTQAAYEQLYDSMAGRVFGWLRVQGARDPEDLTSEVFLRVFSHLSDFSGDESGFVAWVFTIARRVLIDEHRRGQRRVITVELPDPLPDTPAGADAETEALAGVERDAVAEMLASLTADQRDVLTLRIIADLPIEQVARVLGKRPGTIKALQHRGVAALRRRLAEVPS